ncbi:MAG: CPBP family intramembrane metalloprotease [Oscillospiraceae bacterium]|nr:CPBP family intramembrane metalloprotease [Oscillospiraceae bacterium]
MTENLIDTKSAKKIFSAVGIAMTVFMILAFILQILWDIIPTFIWGEDNWFTSSLGAWFRTIIPMYLIAFPICFLLMKRVPAETSAGVKLGGKNFWLFIPIILCVMYAGNIIGTILSYILSGGTAQNPLENLLFDDNPMKILVVVILAPIIEEFICRKLIIDRTRKYGEKTAILLSALVFGLLHGNLYQFFYAFGLGLIFAYIYVRTGRLRYSIIYHTIVNFIGSAIAPFMLSLVDLSKLSTVDANTSNAEAIEIFTSMMPGLAILLIYVFLLLSFAILGLVLLIIQCRKLVFKTAPAELPKGTVFKTVYINTGMILFILLSIATFVFALI